MIDRYNNRQVAVNENDMYKEFFNKRNILLINQYKTPEFTYPNKSQLLKINTIEHIWSVGDRYSKLSSQYYGDPSDWWIIAKFNKKPTEAHINIGDIILIPVPLIDVIRFMRG